MIPRFFQDVPPKKKRRTVSKWRLEVIATFPITDSIVHSEIYEGTLRRAYLKIRFIAFMKDLVTRGADYGIRWRIIDTKASRPSTVAGYKTLCDKH